MAIGCVDTQPASEPPHEIPIEETMMPQSTMTTGTIIGKTAVATQLRIPMPVSTVTDRIRNGEFGKQEKWIAERDI